MAVLTEKQAYEAMMMFLEKFWRETNSDGVAVLLGEMQFLSDGGTADPAAWADWIECVTRVLEDKNRD